jgi:TonB-linked SusC/RagA family outer membrane protein
LSNGTSNIINSGYAYDVSLYSLFSRFDYSYDDRYLVSGTVRRDGSSQFGADKRYGIFPSFSLGWRLSQEGFMKDIRQINDLKLRGSWGKLGSQNNIGPNNAFTLFNSNFQTSYYDINGTSNNPVQGFYSSSNGNPNTGWEEDIITNIGVDATVFNKVDLSVEWYKKSINGLLFTQPVLLTAGGAEAPVVNIGDIQNKGWDVAANYSGGNSNRLQYNIGVNVTSYKNMVINIPGEYFDVANSGLGNLVRNQVGRPVGSFFGYEVERLFVDQRDVDVAATQEDAAPGRFKYRDVNGDGAITPEDRTFFGNPNPDFTYGINMGASYKGFDFSALFYGSQGNEVLNHIRYYTDFFGSFIGGKSKDLFYNSWTPQRTNAKTPIAELSNTFSTSGVANSYYMENGSFFKCRSMILGYTINPKDLERLGMTRLRVYVQAANLFTITKYTGLDPELSGSSSSFGIDYGNYPNNQKSLLVGLNLSF